MPRATYNRLFGKADTILHVTKGLALALGCGLLLSASAAAQEFTIRLTRPSVSGQRYRLTAEASRSRRVVTKKDGEVLRDQQTKKSVELVAEVTVMRLNAKGRVSQKLMVIERFVQTEDESRRELLAKGDVLILSSLDGKPTFRLKGSVLTPSATKALELIFGSNSRAADDDELFGSRQRRKVGDSWPINAEAVARSLKSEGLEVATEQVSGQMQLARRLKYADIDSLHISGRMKLAEVTFADAVLPGYELFSSSAEGTFSGIFPINLAQGKLYDTKTLVVDFVMRGKTGIAAGHEITVRMEKKTQSKIMPLGR